MGTTNVDKFTTGGRDRLNSAFQKYDPKNDKEDQNNLKKGNEGEPSFGANSKQRSGSG